MNNNYSSQGSVSGVRPFLCSPLNNNNRKPFSRGVGRPYRPKYNSKAFKQRPIVCQIQGNHSNSPQSLGNPHSGAMYNSRSRPNVNPRPNNQPQGKNNYSTVANRPYISDPAILSRVREYIESIGRNNVDFDHLVEELLRQHIEYRRRKRLAFRQYVRKALDVVDLENEERDMINDDDDDYEEDEEDDSEDRRSPALSLEGEGDVNASLEDSYMQQNSKKRKLAECSAQELISIITSDEDEAEEIITTTNEDKAQEKSKQKIPKKETMFEKENAKKENHSDKESDDVIVEHLPKTAHLTPRKRRIEPVLSGKSVFKTSLEPLQPRTSFKDIGGNEKVLEEVTQLLIHMRHPEVYRELGVSPPRGFLLHGPPGSGKTLLAHAIAGELKVPLLKVAAPELVGGLSGQSEERIRELFEQAVALAPCVMFIDEVDAITPNRETVHREMERRIVAQLLASMDELTSNENGDQVLVIGATNRPDSLDPALRRAGRFDREVCLGIPDRDSRESILRSLSQSLRLAPELSLEEVASMTPGYVGADLKSLVTEAAMAAVNRLFKSLNKTKSGSENCSEKIENEKSTTVEKSLESEENKCEGVLVEPTDKSNQPPADDEIMIVEETCRSPTSGQKEDEVQLEKGECRPPEEEPLAEGQPPASGGELSLLHSPPLTKEQLEGVFITKEDFQIALKSVQPSAKREGFATVPDVKWEDIGSLKDIRHELQMAILGPVKYPKQFAAMGLELATGVLLCGPPGCGKTLLAKAIANEAGINFISVKGPELLNMYVGESERAVRQCFQRARSSQPCVIFFDEIDALCPKRTNMENGASRVVNQLLTEMDGVESRAGVFLMAATNRPDIVDPAVMRPGRLDKVLYVGLPSPDDRLDILQALTKRGERPGLTDDVDLAAVARDSRCEGYSGADLAALVREASVQALQDFMTAEENCTSSPNLRVSARHFTSALNKIRPSVSDKDKKRYEDLRLQYAAVPSVG